MTTESQAWDALVEFIEPIMGKPLVGRNRFTRETDLYHDLDLNPATIARVLADWSARFSVDMTEFDIERYYPFSKLRASKLLVALLKAPFSREARDILGGSQLTLGMLQEAMLRGKWIMD